ncbi:hypothetical protein F5I97DRAFT_1928677 [Phlebopus sp. FC_14]|nr:hypothetical protein F5I97DRAFT_1928677 [Phlebopus sp. FC_14]
MKILQGHTTRNLARIRRKSVARAKHALWAVRTSFHQCVKHIPQQPQDRVVLFMFTCCLITFTRALLGLGFEEKGPCTFHIIQGSPSLPGMPNRKASGSAVNKMCTTLGWQEDVFFTDNAFGAAPASIPQDAFPDPTPAQYLPVIPASPTNAVHASRLSQDRMAFGYNYNADGLPFDPFRLEFSDFQGEQAYPLQELPSTSQKAAKRGRRFGRRLLSENCG